MKPTIIHDTIRIIEKTQTLANPDNENIYTQIISSQSSVYNSIINVLLGILAVFLGVSIWYNLFKSKEAIKEAVKQEIEAEKRKINEELERAKQRIKEELSIEINLLHGERARLFAMTLKGTDYNTSVDKLTWWIASIHYYKLSNQQALIRTSCKGTIEVLKMLETIQKTSGKSYLLKNYSHQLDFYMKTFDEIPSALREEQNQIKNLYKRFLE